MNKIISILEKGEEFNSIITKIKALSFDNLDKHPHFTFSVMEKMTDITMIKETFSKVDLIKSIEVRENEKKGRHYGLNYELKDGTFIVISLVFSKERVMVINGFHVNKSYKHFMKSLRKNYGKKFN